MNLKTKKQIRFYGNYDLSKYIHFAPFNDDWGSVFNYLFKPSPLLQIAGAEKVYGISIDDMYKSEFPDLCRKGWECPVYSHQ